jgi:hypothetical protein
VCIGPANPDHRCDPIEGSTCPNEGEVCAANTCVIKPGSCTSHAECPVGYLCSGGQCLPERDGEACADPTSGPDLNGTYRVSSVLHLRDGLPGVVDKILGVTEDLRDIAQGKIDLDLPSVVEFVIGGIVSGVIRAYIPPWAIDLVTALGDVSDMLDDMQVDSVMTLTGTPCSGAYRVNERWEWIRFEYQGREMRFRPDQLPNGVEVEPSEFSARYSCGNLYFDEHRIKDQLNHLIRYLLDTMAYAVTGYPTVEQAVAGMIDCWGIGYELDSYVAGSCSYCPSVAGIAAGACEGLVFAAVSKMGEEIDKATVKLSLIKRKGSVVVNQGPAFDDGRWYGSLAGGDFPGEFTMQSQ